ncbi:metallophosphoesterase [Clostridium sp. LP20]|uniref:metallophosphoesterase n=1 Tax=Clostridium sp. LP20 TaxID=3418665 RepID=UPI003EE7553A
MKYLGITVVILLFGLINLYVGKSIFTCIDSNISSTLAILITIFIVLLALSTLLIYSMRYNFGSIIGTLGSYWLGISLMLAIALAGIGALGGILKSLSIVNISKNSMTVIALVLVSVITVYGVYKSNKVAFVSYDVNIDKYHKGESIKIIAISDLHLGYINNNKKLQESVNRINDVNADLVVILGDLFDSNFLAIQNNDETLKILNSIKSTYGTYLCWGNHDAGSTFIQMKEFIMQTNIRVLEDEVIDINGNVLLVGRLDSAPIGYQGEKTREASLETDKFDKEKAKIVLDHQPSNIDEYIGRYDLILSGHTHGGQVYPLNHITKRIFRIDYGYDIFEEDTHAVVTSGLGTWGPPIRIGTRSEIVEINFNY